MKEKLIRFMYGRYGMDQLSKDMSVIALVFAVIGLFIRSGLFRWVPIILLGITYFRMFSRNTNKRYLENMNYLKKRYAVMSKVTAKKEELACRKTHRIFACPGCGQKVRVPKGKGKVNIRCPKCNVTFIKKS